MKVTKGTPPEKYIDEQFKNTKYSMTNENGYIEIETDDQALITNLKTKGFKDK